MQNDIFYIVIENRFHYQDCNNYLIEKIFKKREVIKTVEKIIEEIANDGFTDNYHPFIITNDNKLLSQYIFALNLSDYKSLCGTNDFNENEIRINHRNFKNFNKVL